MDTDTQTPTDAETLDQILTGYSRIKSELGVRLLYPTYREGLAALLTAEGSSE